eukprot:RCo023105
MRVLHFLSSALPLLSLAVLPRLVHGSVPFIYLSDAATTRKPCGALILGLAVPSAGSAPFGEAFIAETIMVYFFQSSACEIGRETGILFPFLCVPKGDEVAISAFFAVYDSLA